MISVFTPSHDPRFLNDAYCSLKSQTDPNWEWTVLINNTSEGWFGCDDPRLNFILDTETPPHVGALKRRACEIAKGDILLELDHDDLLAPTAIEETRKAFENHRVGFVYSNAIRCNMDWTPEAPFILENGWQYRGTRYDGHDLVETVSFEPTPEAVSRIWFAPDHLRAFRRSAYEAAGGYNADMRVLDDQDLMGRMYALTEFKHIDLPLYVYRIHGENSWLKHNAEIQNNVYRLYDKHIEAMVLADTKRRGLRALDLGSAHAPSPGYESVDLHSADVIADLNGPWPFEDSSVGVIRAFDIFEHLRDPLHTMKEVSRVLAPGGWLFAQVPSTDGRGAFQDPTHVSFWNENSWLYYSHWNWARYIGCPVRFQAVRRYTTEKNDIGVCWTVAHLVNLKDGYRPPGLIEI